MAAQYVGCAPATILRTAERDPAFAEELYQAKCNAELSLVRNIRTAAGNEKYWRAAAWALERFFPDKYLPSGLHSVSAEQLAQVLTQFAQLIVREVPVERYRKNILKGVEDLVRSLGQNVARQADEKTRRETEVSRRCPATRRFRPIGRFPSKTLR